MEPKATCPVCGSDNTNNFLTRPRVPVHQNLLIDNQTSAEHIARGDLRLALCRRCGFIYNSAFDVSKLRYGHEYDNTQACSPFFGAYLDSLVAQLVEESGVKNCQIVEVGCGKGLFLRKLVEFEDAGNQGHGFDPSYDGPDVRLGGHLKFSKRYYGPDCLDVQADVVVCRHVIEHVPDPPTLLNVMRQALANGSGGRVFIETPCVEWILENQAGWDFFYEHCSYFSPQSLSLVMEQAGLKVDRISHVFEGQYLWAEGSAGDASADADVKPDIHLMGLVDQYSLFEEQLKINLAGLFARLAAEGKVALWGAGAKGVTLANLIDQNRSLIDCVVDLNPNKQGKFIPGAGHPIVGHEALGNRGIATAVLMNPNYIDENLRLLREAHLNVKLVDLMEYVKK